MRLIPHMTFALVALMLTLATAAPAMAVGTEDFPADWFWHGDDEKKWERHEKLLGTPMPDLDLSDWVGDPVTAADLKGKIVVIDLWATWCGPCVYALPHNNEMQEKYADQGVVILAVCSSNGQEKMPQVIEDRLPDGVHFPMARDKNLTVSKAFDAMWWPTYALVDRDGTIRAIGLRTDKVEAAVDKMLELQPYKPEPEVASGPATIDPAWLEGNAEQRERFVGLEGTTPPPLHLTNWINTEAFTAADLKGKVVLIDFWATWCGPCLRAIPHTNDMQEQYGPQGLVILGVCHSKGAEKMADVVEEHGIQFPVAADIEGKTDDAWRVNGYPDYYLIDRAGNLRIADCKNASVEAAIQALLAEPNPYADQPTEDETAAASADE